MSSYLILPSWGKIALHCLRELWHSSNKVGCEAAQFAHQAQNCLAHGGQNEVKDTRKHDVHFSVVFLQLGIRCFGLVLKVLNLPMVGKGCSQFSVALASV